MSGSRHPPAEGEPHRCSAVEVQSVIDGLGYFVLHAPRQSGKTTVIRWCGGLDHVSTVLAELAEVLTPDALAAAAALCPVTWVQRLGWLLDRDDQAALADALVLQVAVARRSRPAFSRPRPAGELSVRTAGA